MKHKNSPHVRKNDGIGPLEARNWMRNRPVEILNRSHCRKARRAAIVLAGMSEDIAKLAPPNAQEICQSLVWAAFRMVHWLNEAARCSQLEAFLKCLVEASCSNFVFKGILVEGDILSHFGRRHRELLLSQSRRLGRLVWELCEVTGKNILCFEKP